jgi:cobalt-zinc-cadmium efflux system outer membrane protein
MNRAPIEQRCRAGGLRKILWVFVFAASTVAALTTGCATVPLKPDQTTVLPEATILKSSEMEERVFSGAVTASPTQGKETAMAGDIPKLTLAELQKIAHEKNPTFAEYAASRETAKAEVLQALAYPNPDIEIDLDYALSLFQPVEFPGKRKARRAAAEAAKPVVEREEEVFRATLTADVGKAYCTVLYYEHSVELAKESLKTEQEIEQIVGRRVDAGEAAEIDRIKAQVETLKASRAVQAQERRRNSARAILNALCGRTAAGLCVGRHT